MMSLLGDLRILKTDESPPWFRPFLRNLNDRFDKIRNAINRPLDIPQIPNDIVRSISGRQYFIDKYLSDPIDLEDSGEHVFRVYFNNPIPANWLSQDNFQLTWVEEVPGDLEAVEMAMLAVGEITTTYFEVRYNLKNTSSNAFARVSILLLAEEPPS